jgi:hypothetical protein
VPVPETFAKAPEMKLAAANRDRPADAAGDSRATPASFTEAIEEPASPLTDNPAPLTAVAAVEVAEEEFDRYAPGSTARVGLIERSATRPQPIGQPQQQVLEWERSDALDARAPTGTVLR